MKRWGLRTPFLLRDDTYYTNPYLCNGMMIKELMREVTFTQASRTSTKARGSDCSVQSNPGLGV